MNLETATRNVVREIVLEADRQNISMSTGIACFLLGDALADQDIRCAIVEHAGRALSKKIEEVKS